MFVGMNICMYLFIRSKKDGNKEKGRCSPSFPLGDPRRCLQLLRSSQSRRWAGVRSSTQSSWCLHFGMETLGCHISSRKAFLRLG